MHNITAFIVDCNQDLHNYFSAGSTNETSADFAVIKIQSRTVMEAYYYTYPKHELINESINLLENKMSIVYSNPDASILVRADMIND
jgi:hypothetical protein